MEHMKHACELASKSVENGTGPFGAVIIDNLTNEILAEGNNLVTKNNDPTAHAEIIAIRNACLKKRSFILKNCSIYSSCEPCPMCLSSIYWARIDNIYYANTRNDAKKIGFDDEHIYEEISKPNDSRTIPMTQCLSENRLDAFEVWSSSQDKIEY
jgi:tRNA(Arg) A34 adenosine deaminase TadA